MLAIESMEVEEEESYQTRFDALKERIGNALRDHCDRCKKAKESKLIDYQI